MWQILLTCAKYIGVFLLFGIIWFVSYCVFYGDDVKVKTKTVYFVVLSELIAVAVAFLSWLTFRQGNTTGAIVGWIVSAALAIAFVFAAVYGHKREWNNEQE